MIEKHATKQTIGVVKRNSQALFTLLSEINVKKLPFIDKLTASDTSKTAKITKR